MSALVLDYSNEVRIDAPLRMVWSHLSDLNYILQFIPERDDFEVAEDGSHGSCHAVLVVGPLHIPMTIDVELGDLIVDEKVTFACSIDALATTLDMVITLRRASAQETAMRYSVHATVEHRLLGRLSGPLTARLEDHVDGFCSNAAVFISRHAKAEERLLHSDD
jgi:carbon monoxide dehydrogenase subunit G